MSDASRHSLYIVEETEYGVTPTSPVFTKIRHTGTTLGMAKGSQLSEELSADRQVKDFRHGTRQIGGDISVELSFDSHDDLLEAVLAGTWDDEGVGATPAVAATAVLTIDTQPTAGDELVIDSTTYTFVAFADFDDALEIPIGNELGQTQNNIVNAILGQDGENAAHGSATISAFSGNDATVTALTAGDAGNTITTTIDATGGNAFDTATLEDGADAVAGTPGVRTLKAGTVRRSFTILRHFEDIGMAGEPYHLFTGVEFNTLSISITPDAIVTMTFGVVGRDASSSTTAPAGATLGDPTTTRVFNAFNGSVEIDEEAFAIATELSLTLENGIEPRYVIGSDKTISPSNGRSNMTGSLGVWFEDSVFLNKFWDEDLLALVMTLVDPGGNEIEITLPALSLTGGQPDVSGQSSIPLTVPFQAIYDDTEESQIKIVATPDGV